MEINPLADGWTSVSRRWISVAARHKAAAVVVFLAEEVGSRYCCEDKIIPLLQLVTISQEEFTIRRAAKLMFG